MGKSTLFNRLTKTRDALVADFPGLTRDRRYGMGRALEREFLVVDTAGFDPVAKEGIVHEMAKQAEQAIAEGKAVPFDDGEPVDGSEDADDAAPVAPAAKGKRKGKDAAPVAPAAPVDPAADAPASDGTATTVDPDAAPIA